MNKLLLILLYFGSLMAICSTILLALEIKKEFIQLNELNEKPQTTEQYKNEKLVSQIRIGFMIPIVMMLLFANVYLVPCLMDIPYFVTNRYDIATGVVTRRSKGRSINSVEIEDSETGKILKLGIFGNVVEVGDYIEVNYMPYSKQATITKRIPK